MAGPETDASGELSTSFPDRWEGFREGMPVARKYAYFDHAAVAPLPQASRLAIENWVDQATRTGDVSWPLWAERVEQVRRSAARLIAADDDEIALIPNTTTGIGLVAEGWKWEPGDNVVVPANEFPSNLYPWMNLASRGVETRLVPVDDERLDLNRLAEHCDARTRVIAASWVGYAQGWRLDVDQLVQIGRQFQAAVFLDAIQGMGIFPLDVRKTAVDFLAADGHKWMLGPEGAGMLFVRRGMLERLRPVHVGWNSVKHRYNFSHTELDLRDSAARYEGGSQNMVGIGGWGTSLELLAEMGNGPSESAVAERILQLTRLAAQRLTKVNARILSEQSDEHASGILAFQIPGTPPEEIKRRCFERDVVLSCRNGALRISPHAYNNEQDIDRMIDAIRNSS